MTKPRKGSHHTSPIPILLAMVQPDWREIESEADARKREARKRERELATDELLRIYSDHARRRALASLDPQVAAFCDDLKRQNGGRMPRPKGGRPEDLHRRLLIFFRVREKMAAMKVRRGAVQKAIDETASQFNVTIRTVRDIYYDGTDGWLKLVQVEQSRREYERGADLSLSQDHTAE